jgi:competence protein ComEC
VGIAFAVGVLVGAQAGASDQAVELSVIVLGLAALIPLSARPPRPYLVFAIAGCVLGVIAGELRAPAPPQPYAGPETVSTRATVISDPQVSKVGKFADVRWTDHAGTQRHARAFLPAAPPAGRGDAIEISTQVGGRYGEELEVSALRVTSAATEPERLRRRLRAAVSQRIAEYVPGSPGSLTLGLLIGDDSALTAEERDALRMAGLSHITAVSGWNVTLVISLIGSLCLAIGLRGRIWLAAQLVALAGYVWIVGLDPPVVRAAIMAVVALAAIRLGRPRHALTMLALSAALMVAVTPDILGSLSFQLSVLATLGVSVGSRWTTQHVGWRAWIAAPVIISLAVGLVTAPLLALRFGIVTVASVPANVLAAPLVVVATVGGSVVIATGWLPLLPDLAGTATWIACTVLLTIADALARLPAGHWRFQQPTSAAVAVLSIAVLAVMFAVTPEGRAIGRRLTHWASAEPLAAGLAGASSAVVLIAAMTLL